MSSHPRARRALVILLVVLALGSSAAAHAQAESRPRGQRLLVLAQYSLRVIDTSGSQTVIASSVHVGGADWGPGGRTVTFGGSKCIGPCALGTQLPHQSDLRTVRSDGGSERTHVVLPLSSTWNIDRSPDGRWVAFLAVHGVTCWGCPAAWELYVYDLRDGALLSFGPAWDFDWAPDGRRIALTSLAGVHVVDVVAGAVPQRITATHLEARAPVWSPDGRRLAFLLSPRPGGLPQVHVARADGTGQRSLGVRTWHQPSWAPDGRRLMVISDDAARLVVVGVHDGSSRTVHRPRGVLEDVAWSPDGRYVAYKLGTPGRMRQEVHIVRPDGTGPRRLFVETGWLGELRWAPPATTSGRP